MLSTTNITYKPYEVNYASRFFKEQVARSAAGVDVTVPTFPFYVRDRLPVHVLENYPQYVKFIETYFEWLGISNGINDIPYLMDVNSISSDLLIHHKDLFAKIFPENNQYKWSDPENSIIDLRRFLTFVRDFYLTKGTEESIRFLLSSIYNLDSNSIDFDYPKVRLCLLSDSIWVPTLDEDTDAAGNTYEGYWKDSRTTLSGGVRLQDSYYQQFSYSISAISREVSGEYSDNTSIAYTLGVVKDIAHPAGFRLINNIAPDTYTPAEPGPVETGYSEHPLIGHYLPYTFSTTLNPRQPYPSLCNVVDWFPCGFNPYETNPLQLVSTNCFTSAHDPNEYPIGWTAGVSGEDGYVGPTYGIDTYNTAQGRGYTFWVVYHHPAIWSEGLTAGTAFGDMKLGQLVNLTPDVTKNYSVSPNDPVEDVSSCTLA